MSRNKLIFVICSLSLFLIAASIPSKKAAADGQAPAIRLIVPEGVTFGVPESRQSGGKRGAMSLHPANTTEKRITVVGAAEDGAQPEIEIVNNGQPEITPVFHGQYFHARVTLSLGPNNIQVRWRRGGAGGWNVQTISIVRYTRDQGGPVGGYPPYVFHTPENEKQCRQCHQMRLTADEIDSGMDKSCIVCHADLLANVHVHGPVNVYMCAACHNPDSRPNRYRIGKDDNVLCYSCHDDRKDKDTKRKYMHGPVGAGMCTVCHSPHGSPNEYQLVRPIDQLCVMCHQDEVDGWLGRFSVHPPFEEGKCYKCHSPHSSNHKYNLRRDEKDVCFICHKYPVPGHWHDSRLTKPLFDLPDFLPLYKDGTMMCLTCHDPHGAEGFHLTRRRGCRACHPVQFPESSSSTGSLSE